MTESAWKAAARHWWERMRQAERERDEWRRRFGSGVDHDEHNALALLDLYHERAEKAERERDELLQKLEELRGSLARETAVRLAHESAAVVKGVYAQPSGIPGELADLAERIAKADGKHPKDLPDTSHEINAERVGSRLARARVELEAFPAWDNAFECEVAEASAEIALGNPERLADELLDVATVAMRWRRAVLERGKR